MYEQYEQYRVVDKNKLQQIEDALLDTYFTQYDQEFLSTDSGREDIKANVYRRYNQALKHVVPWTANQIDLQGKTLLEIGSGTGSSTAAFAHFVEKIDGYDIDAQSLAGARVRMEIMGFDNVALHLVKPEDLVGALKKNHADGVDIILLFAVLEHQTIEERHDTLKLCWDLLNPDGVLVITETPNLLQYADLHTSLLPFMHLLPTELYGRYVNRSPREGFSDDFTESASMPLEELDILITRWGRGASFHDFELALGKDHGKYIVATGFEEEILSWFGVHFEEELLRHYFLVKELEVPLAFSRAVLNLIYKKNETPVHQHPAVPENNFIADQQLVLEREKTINILSKQLIAVEKDRHELVHAQELTIKVLSEQLAASEKQRQDMLNSKRWLLGDILTAPYRKLKSLFTDSAS